MSDSVRPQRRQPTRLPHPWDSPGKDTGVGCHFLLQCVKVKSLSRVRLVGTPWTAAHQAPPSMGLSRQEYWSGVPLPSPSNALKKGNIACLIGLLSVSQELIPRKFLSECLVHAINIMRTTYTSISLEGKAFPAVSTSLKERSLILTNQ